MNAYKKYYLELKNRFTLLVFTWLFGLLICFIYKDILLFVLINSSKCLSSSTKQYFIFTNVSELFYVYLELTFFVANQTVVLMFFYHTLLFLASGLYKVELLKLQNALRFFLLCWICSIVLLYKIVVPYTWDFFLSFQQPDNGYSTVSFFFEAKIEEYLHYFVDLYYLCLLNCQLLTVVVLMLTGLSQTSQNIKSFRKLFYFVFVMFSTLTTPPDIISQAVLSSILILFYEMVIIFKFVKINMVAN